MCIPINVFRPKDSGIDRNIVVNHVLKVFVGISKMAKMVSTNMVDITMSDDDSRTPTPKGNSMGPPPLPMKSEKTFRPTSIAVPQTPVQSKPIAQPPSPVSSENGGYLQRSRDLPSPEALENMFLTPRLIEELKSCFPALISKQHWDRPTGRWCYIWALKNPRTALMLYITRNVDVWPIAAIFAPLTDNQLPHDEASISPILNDYKPFLEKQHHVLVRNVEAGTHMEISAYETLPFELVYVIKSEGTKSVERVRYRGDGSVYARKSIRCTRVGQKGAILNEIATFKNLQHSSIAKLACTYAQGAIVSLILHPAASMSLGSYLALPSDRSSPDLLKNWMGSLVEGLEYIHAEDVRHKNIRPSKIVLDGEKALFTAFRISGSDTRGSSSMAHEETFIYAAPEVFARYKYSKASDIFSLGAVLLEMITVIKQQSIAQFRAYRTTNGDPSFQSNLPKISTWIAGLQETPRDRKQMELGVESMALELVTTMLEKDHFKRPKAKALSVSFARWNTWRRASPGWAGGDLGMFSSGDRWGDLRSLDSFYSHGY
jgi:Protein kinase domain